MIQLLGDALLRTTTGPSNTAIGSNTLGTNTTGNGNSAIGSSALKNNTSGSVNTAIGTSALTFNTTGKGNTATGVFALARTTTGSTNTAIGSDTLGGNTTGSSNTAIGNRAGINATTGNNNIYVNHEGVVGESQTIRIGTPGTQTRAFIAGITSVVVASARAVLIDGNGQLGTISSSRRFKEHIHDMGDASRGLMRLRPVTFRYKGKYAAGSREIQYGLIAEEVAEVYPDLVVHSATGEVETVQYHKVNAMVLNEVQKQHRKLEAQARQLRAQQEQIKELLIRLENMEGER